ncbi:Ger(x)C family spore germination protein [Alkalihalobacterium bogoriense]|uniref:Ger(x)C family spore germination protein n=1 Tax=Alkalihalobacterium bogoriense TaxID=246272 RepID=UPI000686E1F0|nr:Ger(x)C family spore germination protein [Alkalihalobacterium bogoriense]
MKQKWSVIASLLLLLFSTGCWDRKEINDIAIVTATTYDKLNETEYIVTTQIPLPGEMGGTGSEGGGGTSGGAMFLLDAGVGRNVREANAELQQRLSRQLIFGHRRVAVFGEGLAREGVRKTLDVLTRTREARLATQLFVAEGDANKILAAKPHLENLTSEAIRELGVNHFEITLRDFLIEFQQKGSDPFLPVLSLVDNLSPDPELIEEQIGINKVAMFKDDKVEFFTDENQTKAIKWILGKMEGKSYAIDWTETESINTRIKQQSGNLSYKIENDKPVFIVTIDLTGSIIENETEINFEEHNSLERVNEKIKEDVKAEVNSILEETFARNMDSFGFGWLLKRRERERWHNEWKDSWRENLPDLEYEVHVNSDIEWTGLTTKGIGVGE